MRRVLAALVLGTLCLAGCSPTQKASQEQDKTGNSQAEALAQAMQAGLLQDDMLLTEQQAYERVIDPFDEESYTAEPADAPQTATDAEGQERRCYVFTVYDTQGGEIGRVAIDMQTGEKFTWQDGQTLADYTSFPLYDAEAEQPHGWSGDYDGLGETTLSIDQESDQVFAFTFSDGTRGRADISGNTAKSMNGEINFLLSGDMITVAGGGLTGNYKAQTVQG